MTKVRTARLAASWRFFALILGLLLLVIACGGSKGAAAPAATPCRDTCEEQEHACELGCRSPKSGADATNADCSSRCIDKQSECIRGC